MAQCVNIRDIEVTVESKAPGTLAQEIITSMPIAEINSISLIFDFKADLLFQADSKAWEALEDYLCRVADQKLKRDPPEKFTVTLVILYDKMNVRKDEGEVRLGKFLDGLQKRGVLEVKVP